MIELIEKTFDHRRHRRLLLSRKALVAMRAEVAPFSTFDHYCGCPVLIRLSDSHPLGFEWSELSEAEELGYFQRIDQPMPGVSVRIVA